MKESMNQNRVVNAHENTVSNSEERQWNHGNGAVPHSQRLLRRKMNEEFLQNTARVRCGY